MGWEWLFFSRHLNMTVCHGFSDNFAPKKRGESEKEKEGLWLQTLFRLIGKREGRLEKSTISIREKMPILWLFYFPMFQTLFWLLNSFNWLISFQIDHLDNSWSITHSICCSWKKSIDFWLSSCAKTWSNYQQRPQDINNIPIKYPEGPTTFSHLLLHWS